MDRQLPVWASLTLVAAISAVLLVSTHLITQVFAPPEGAIGKDSAQGEALPAAELFVPVEIAPDTGIDNCYKGQTGGQTVGYAAQVTVKGYGGPIELVVGMDMNGALTGISVDGAQFNETPGLGAKSKEPEFKNQFVGIQTPVGLSASDATSSATGEWTATPEPNTDAAPTGAGAATAADATSSASQTGEWTATPAPDAVTASGSAVVTPAADAASSATQTGEWTTEEPVEVPAEVPAADATSSATQTGEWSTETPAADATSSATQTGEWTAEALAADATAAPEAATASTVDAISGATITSKAIVGGVNLCADFIKSLLAGGNA